MESTGELQQQEVTALKSIYGDDFQEVPAPKAWRVRLVFRRHFFVGLKKLYTTGRCETH